MYKKGTRRGNSCSSHLLPPAHTLDGSAARISMQDFLMICEIKQKEKKKKKNSHKTIELYNIDLCVPLSVWMSVCVSMWYMCHTESMIPLRAWKPPHTGNTCSTLSAIVASQKNIQTQKGEKKNHICFFNVFATSSVSFSGSYLGLVEFFDPYTVNNSPHRPGPLCLQKINKYTKML